MTKVRFAAFATILSFFLPLAAQHSCGTDHYYQSHLKNDPSLAILEKEYNEKMVAYQNAPVNRAAIYTIPVVFHIIHTNGPENISREQILDQLRVLNQDYNFLNPNKSKIRSAFTSVAADCQIKFVLASVDPNGNCTDGVNRVYSPLGVEVDQDNELVKGLIQWDYRKYLNVWIVTSIKSNGNGTLLGYAQFPWMNKPSTDGIVMRHDRCGTIGTAIPSDSGRTLTHEVGHWLGLYHTFQDGCNSGDFCDDTPPVDGAFTNANCPANGNSCSNDNPNLPDQWENYMDYSNGSCMAMFTLKQKSRMHGFLTNNPRSLNVSTSNLTATGATLGTGAPVAFFSSSQKMVCAGSSVTFYDLSCKAAVTARSWSFPGGSISSSTDKNPVVTYQTPGKYKVTLLVQNASGNNTRAVDEYIEVVAKANAKSPNFEEGFEVDNPASRGYISVSPKSWEVVSNASYTGTKSFKAPVSSSDAAGTNYSFVLPAVNLSLLANANPKFTFYAAYAPASTTATEILRAYVSTDCGSSFRQILERSGTGLSYNTSAPVTANFVPTGTNQWKLFGILSLANLGLNTETNVIFRIDVIGAKGNPVYIDNINVGAYTAGVDHWTSGAEVQLFPNPAQDKANLQFNLPASTETRVELLDMAGRLIKTVHSGMLPQGSQTLEIMRPQGIPGTLYFVKISTPEGQITKPLTFAP